MSGALIELHPSIAGLSPNKVRDYELQYMNEEDLLTSRFGDDDVRCEDCDLVIRDNSIGCADCPCGFEWGDVHCVRWNEYYVFKMYLIQADMMLRNTLGDLWSDEYSA